ncbi:cysteine protease [Lithospermum erythrorhizon]|uniref:Cysteine protease n=1 Tax=Lithospermum erythrorhizon TaxID=34254 RepID=A0AAV3NQY4_LITER
MTTVEKPDNELDQEFQENDLCDMNLHECEFWVQIWDVPCTYLTKNTAENLGKGLGRVRKIDVDSKGNIKDKFIRIRVGINVVKPLKRIIKAVMGGKEDEVAKELGVPVELQRFKRQNCTYRPYRPSTYVEENLSVGQLIEVDSTELKIFLEMELGLDSLRVTPPPLTKDDILLFFKLSDPCKEELSYVGRLFVKAWGKPIEILTKLNEMVGYAPHEEIDLYELEDGDIICFQKSLPAKSRQQLRYPDVPSVVKELQI